MSNWIFVFWIVILGINLFSEWRTRRTVRIYRDAINQKLADINNLYRAIRIAQDKYYCEVSDE